MCLLLVARWNAPVSTVASSDRLSSSRAMVLAGASLILALGLVEIFGLIFAAFFSPPNLQIPAFGTPGTPGYIPARTLDIGGIFFVTMAWIFFWSIVTSAFLAWSVRLMRSAKDAGGAGVIAIVAGALSLLSGGGFVAGAILCILGGARAIHDAEPRSGAPPARPA